MADAHPPDKGSFRPPHGGPPDPQSRGRSLPHLSWVSVAALNPKDGLATFSTTLRKLSSFQFWWKGRPVTPTPRPPSARSVAHISVSDRPFAFSAAASPGRDVRSPESGGRARTSGLPDACCREGEG